MIFLALLVEYVEAIDTFENIFKAQNIISQILCTYAIVSC